MKFKVTDKENKPLPLASVDFKDDKIAYIIVKNPSNNLCDVYKPSDLNWDITFEKEDYDKFRVVVPSTGETIWEKTTAEEMIDKEKNEVTTRLLTISKDEEVSEIYRAWAKSAMEFILRRLDASS